MRPAATVGLSFLCSDKTINILMRYYSENV